jgi:hypothetical protein
VNDAVCENYPNCRDKLSPNSNIVCDKKFESAIVKIQQGMSNALSPAELIQVKHLQKKIIDKNPTWKTNRCCHLLKEF